jgi:hypothetical protein
MRLKAERPAYPAYFPAEIVGLRIHKLAGLAKRRRRRPAPACSLIRNCSSDSTWQRDVDSLDQHIHQLHLTGEAGTLPPHGYSYFCFPILSTLHCHRCILLLTISRSRISLDHVCGCNRGIFSSKNSCATLQKDLACSQSIKAWYRDSSSCPQSGQKLKSSHSFSIIYRLHIHYLFHKPISPEVNTINWTMN